MLLFKNCFLIIFILFSYISPSFAQFLKGNYNITSTVGYGFIIKHSTRMGQIASSHFPLYELSIRKITDGAFEWHSIYKYPEMGIDIGYIPFKNPILGNGAYLIPFIEKKLAKSQCSAFNFKIGFGLSYTSNPYNSESNFQNVAISAPIGYALRGELSYSYQINTSFRIRSVIMFTHFSNASYTQPNAGLNIPVMGIGISFLPNYKKYKMLQDTFSHQYENKKITYNIVLGATVSEVGLPGGKKYWGANIITYVNKRINRKNALNVGVDLFLNSAHKHLMEIDTNIRGRKPDYKQAALALGHELFINKLSIVNQLGVYFYSPYPNIKPLYQRYSIKYWIGKRFFTCISLKCHFGTAEYVEMSTGFKW